MDFETIKSIAPRESGEIDLPNGEKLTVCALDLAGRLGGVEFMEKHNGDGGMYSAYCAAHGCPAFFGKTPEELYFDIDPILLARIGSKIMDLSGMSEDQAEEAEKNSESDPS